MRVTWDKVLKFRIKYLAREYVQTYNNMVLAFVGVKYLKVAFSIIICQMFSADNGWYTMEKHEHA